MAFQQARLQPRQATVSTVSTKLHRRQLQSREHEPLQRPRPRAPADTTAAIPRERPAHQRRSKNRFGPSPTAHVPPNRIVRLHPRPGADFQHPEDPAAAGQ